jgi:hypothetical protein
VTLLCCLGYIFEYKSSKSTGSSFLEKNITKKNGKLMVDEKMLEAYLADNNITKTGEKEQNLFDEKKDLNPNQEKGK